jgi:hypothetical protein
MAHRFAALLVALPVLALVGGALSPAAAAPVAGSARSGDAAATRAFVEANYALARAVVADLPSGRAALTSLVHQIAGSCPQAAAGSPEDGDSERLSDEVIGALSVAVFHLDAPIVARFARAVAPLRWSNRRLTRMVGTYAAKLRGMATLAMPDLCGDVKAWTASGFHTLTASTASFDRRFLAVRIETEEVSPALLKRYERPGEAAVMRRTGRLEGQLVEAEAQAVHDWSRILDDLGLNP